MTDYGGPPPYGDDWYGGAPYQITPYVLGSIIADPPSFATAQDALDARDTTTTAQVFIGGVTVDATQWDARFGQGQVATATITVPLPRPDVVTANAAVQCIGGHNNLVGTLFSGRIPRMDWAMSSRGNLLTIRPVGWASLLSYRSRFDLIFDGPITFNALFDALCARMGVPAYAADTALSPDGVVLTLGGNPQIDEGKVKISASQSPLAFMNSAFGPFGYSVQDDPDGVVRLRRILGQPTDPVVTFTEGVHPFSTRHSYDITGIVNYPDVHGPTYEDPYGASVPIRAFPAVVETDSRIPVNEGVNYDEIRSSMFVTQAMAEFAMQAALIQRSEPSEPVSWEAVAVPGLGIGDAVAVDSGTVEVDGTYHLVDLTISWDGSLTADYEGERGTGEMAAVGDNSTEIVIQTSPIHLGNETLTHYAVDAPSGTSKTWPITIPDRATAINARGLHHGTNSQLIGGVNTDLEVTKWQIWAAGTTNFSEEGQDAPRPETSGNMPIVNEDLALRKNYLLLSNWSPFAVNLSRLDPGDYILRLVCGVKAGPDDLEVRDVYLQIYGIAEPVTVPQEVT